MTENYYVGSFAGVGGDGSPDSGGGDVSVGNAGAAAAAGSLAGAGIVGGSGGVEAGAGSAGDGGSGDEPGLYVPPGKLVFERYSTYAAGDSKMYVVTFPGGTIGPELSATYKICSPYNGIFSPDGSHLVVGGVPGTTPCPSTLDRNKLELFILDLDHPPSMQRVTNNTAPDEDPQYSPDGTFILFKHDGYTRRWVVGSTPFNETACKDANGSYCFFSSGDPQSKPVVSDQGLVCYEQSMTQSDPNGDIYCFNLADGLAGKDISSDANRIHAINHTSIYDSRPVIAPPYLYFTRWRVPAAPHVNFIQRTLLSDLTGPDESCAFCTDPGTGYEDAFSLGEGDLVVYSSNANGMGKGDLFIANFSGKDSKSLNDFAPGVNTASDELGAAYWHASPAALPASP
ncbi:MAG TPA: hypothetical protein VHW01_13445 [Polyangiaceae bacterium]|nr:hypothetical protein [Polyangiaceae bacterium]